MYEESENRKVQTPGDDPAPFAATVTCTLPAVPAMSPIGGSQAWAGQVWPFGKTTPVIGAPGGMRNAWGDLTHPPGSLLLDFTPEQIAEMDRERAACCMPPITPAQLER